VPRLRIWWLRVYWFVWMDPSENGLRSATQTLGLKAAGGKIYPLKRHENVDALFAEKRLQTRVQAYVAKGRGLLALV
jgi:hypothetical protein